MRYIHRWIFVALCVLSVGLLEWPQARELKPRRHHRGSAHRGSADPGPGPVTTVLGDAGRLAPGSLDSLYSELDSISTSLVSAEVQARG